MIIKQGNKKNNYFNLDSFTSLGGGFANEVFLDKKRNLVLKLYSKKTYFDSELMAYKSGFKFMPRLIDSGFIKNKPYMLVSYIGKPIGRFTAKNILPFAKTIRNLHKIMIKNTKSINLINKFKWLYKYDRDIYKITQTNIKELSKRVFSYIKDNSDKLTLIHGDISETNIRKVGQNYYLIDFDESSYSSPLIDFAKLYWSDIEFFKKMSNLELLINKYNKLAGHKIMSNEITKDIFLFAGIDTWCWWRENLNEKDMHLAKQTEKELKKYCEKIQNH